MGEECGRAQIIWLGRFPADYRPDDFRDRFSSRRERRLAVTGVSTAGPNGAGKTTLATWFEKVAGYSVCHGSLTENHLGSWPLARSILSSRMLVNFFLVFVCSSPIPTLRARFTMI